MKPNNYIYVKCTKDSFYRAWLDLLTPYHKLTPRIREVAARVMMQYFIFREHIDDPEVLKDVMWTRKSRKDMMDSLHMTAEHFQIALTKLKNAGFLLNDEINPKYIPHKSPDGSPRLILEIMYDWSTPDEPIVNVKEQDGE